MNPKPAKATDRDTAPLGDAELRYELIRCRGVLATDLIWRSSRDEPWLEPSIGDRPRRL